MINKLLRGGENKVEWSITPVRNATFVDIKTMNTKDWNRKQLEKQKQRVLQPRAGEREREEKDIGYPAGYYPGKYVTFEEAQAIERYDIAHSGTGDARNVWKNRNGDTVAFSY